MMNGLCPIWEACLILALGPMAAALAVAAPAVTIGPGQAMFDPLAAAPKADLFMPITNGLGRDVNISIHLYEGDGKEPARAQQLPLKNNQTVILRVEDLPLAAIRPAPGEPAGLYLSTMAKPVTTGVTLHDADTGEILAQAQPEAPLLVEVLRVKVNDPWDRQIVTDRTPRVTADVEVRLATAHLNHGQLVAELLSKPQGAVVAAQRLDRPHAKMQVSFDTTDVPWGAYDLRVRFVDAGGKAVASLTEPATVLPGEPQQIVPLNNLVSELMNARQRGLASAEEIPFINPRPGWCFFQVLGEAAMALDGDDAPLPLNERGEAMRWLASGRHVLAIAGSPDNIIVRAVPELIYCQYPSNPHIAPHGPYDWEFLAENVLDHCNLIVGHGLDLEAMQRWQERGGRWLTHVTVPNLFSKQFTSEDDAYQHWTASPGYIHPLMDGMIADEFLHFTAEQYLAYAKSLLRLQSDAAFADRDFHAWCTAIHGLEHARAFLTVLMRCGWRHCFERYLAEQATEQAARDHIDAHLLKTARDWEHAIPGSTRRAVITLGYMSHPTESLNTHPNVNYRVFMDMQMHALVNEPSLFGTYGVMQYLSAYADEETVRWAGKLYRHYGIEGRSDRFTDEPYLLAHLGNADFDEGLEGWSADPAEAGSIRAESRNGYSWLQGRYPRTSQGDRFIVMRRGEKPNRVSQPIVELQPGRLYSLKMITGDYQDLVQQRSQRQDHAVNITIEGAELLEGEKNHFQAAYPSNYAHRLGAFNRETPYWMNYHWRVFRATSPTATLTISDWVGEQTPAGPAGQELIFNFIEVQPYDAP